MEQMPNNSPNFVVGFGFNALIVIMLFIIIFIGHKLKFAIKNNLMMFLSSPICILLPLSSEYMNENVRFSFFLILLMILGFLCAF